MSDQSRKPGDGKEKPRSPETPPDEPAPEEAPPEEAPSSLWKMLGRGVGKGLRAARKVGGKTATYLERQGSEDELESRYNVLGRIVAQQIIEWKRSSIDVSDPAIRKVIDEIRELEEAAPEAPPSDGESR